MTETDRTCALLADLLKDGPRKASEILDAAEGANASKRTMQRAATVLGVVKTRAAFRGGWIWCLPEDGETPHSDDEAEATKAPSPAEESGPEMGAIEYQRHQAFPPAVPASPDIERAKVIAARLVKLEAGRGKVAPIYASDPRLVKWVQEGIRDPELREAYELAVFALDRAGNLAPLTVGYLESFVNTVISEGAKA